MFVQIREFPNYVVNSDGEVVSFAYRRWETMKACNSTGYAQVGLWKNGKRYQRYVHALVAEAFLGERPSGKHINHLNGNKLDNRSENLEYCTRKENAEHALSMGLYKTGEQHGRARLTLEQVEFIRQARNQTAKSLAAQFGVSASHIRRLRQGLRWTVIL
jgi:hypothetical protein